MCSGPIVLPLRFKERRVFGRTGRRDFISELESGSCDLTSMARLRYVRVLADGWFVIKSTTALPVKKLHFERLRWVNVADAGIE